MLINDVIVSSVNELVLRCGAASKEAGWWDDAVEMGKGYVPTKLALVHSEVSEALEAHRKNLMDDKLITRSGVEVELADAVIRIADLCCYLGLDLGGAIRDKVAYNAYRPDHKPEARMTEGGKSF